MVHGKGKNRHDSRCDDTLLEHTYTHRLHLIMVGRKGDFGEQEGYFWKLLNRYSRHNLAARDWLALYSHDFAVMWSLGVLYRATQRKKEEGIGLNFQT